MGILEVVPRVLSIDIFEHKLNRIRPRWGFRIVPRRQV